MRKSAGISVVCNLLRYHYTYTYTVKQIDSIEHLDKIYFFLILESCKDEPWCESIWQQGWLDCSDERISNSCENICKKCPGN